MNNKTYTYTLRKLWSVVVIVLATVSLSAQQLSVSGVVKDAVNGEPLFGVNILEKGTSNGTITNLDGEFTLSVPANAVLIFRYVGYQALEVPVAGKTRLNISLTEDAVAIGEVLVIGYGTVKKNDATGSVTAIKPDAMNKGMTTNAQDMLAGKIAGVNVVSAGGAPGAGATIRIRGGSSLSASNDPLIVIDGLAMDNNGIKGVANFLSTINPNDIESFTVLKDASATAIYGSRASNGVIIINTKKGEKNQKPQVSYEGNASISTLNQRYDVLSGDEFRTLVNTVYADQPDVLAELGTHNTDWQEQIYQNALSTDHNISVTGGYKNIPYRVSMGYTNQEGVIKTSHFERITGAVSLSPTFFDDHLRVNLNVKGMWVKNRYAETGAVGSAVGMDPTQPVTSEEEPFKSSFGGYFQWYNMIEGNDGITKPWFNTLAPRNPVSTLLLKDDVARSRDFIGSADFNYKFHGMPELRATLSLGTERAFGRQELMLPVTAASDHNWGRTGWDEISKSNESLNAWLQYAKEAGLHNFDVMGGYEWQHFYREGQSEYRGLMRFDSNEDGVVDATDKYYDERINEWKTENFLVSFFGRANYSFAGKYLLTATVRLDGSSRFSKENRWGTFPSFAFAWKINEEDFLAEVDQLSDLKLRLGYGITGQQDLGQGDYPYIPVFKENKDGAYYPFEENGELVYVDTYCPNVFNNNLKWEETTTYNAGIDFGFFKQRLTGSLDYYHRITNDLLNVVDIPMGTNFSNRVVSNIGSLTNNGIELALNGRIISRKDISWEVGLNLTHNRNEITKLTTGTGEGYYVATGGISTGTGTNAQAHAVGHPASSFYVYKQVYDDNGKPIEGEFADLNPDGIINSQDLYFYKSPAPDLLAGLSSKFIYKDFDFSFSMRSSIGNYMFNDVAARSHDMSDTGIWSTSGFFSNKPRSAMETNFNQNKTNAHLSDYYVQDASFLRMDNITAGYSFKDILGVISEARIYATVQNPFVITAYSGLDPEKFDGIDRDLYPRPMVSLIGVSLKF
ncbi:MAG: TonB-dependent receptor [Paludibacter sp.]|nr:TonB-dependent receptor [Paludibacter sp.]